jgi:hypothetical protein
MARAFVARTPVDRHHRRDPIIHGDIALVTFPDRELTKLADLIGRILGPPLEVVRCLDGFDKLYEPSDPSGCHDNRILVVVYGPRQNL